MVLVKSCRLMHLFCLKMLWNEVLEKQRVCSKAKDPTWVVCVRMDSRVSSNKNASTAALPWIIIASGDFLFAQLLSCTFSLMGLSGLGPLCSLWVWILWIFSVGLWEEKQWLTDFGFVSECLGVFGRAEHWRRGWLNLGVSGLGSFFWACAIRLRLFAESGHAIITELFSIFVGFGRGFWKDMLCSLQSGGRFRSILPENIVGVCNISAVFGRWRNHNAVLFQSLRDFAWEFWACLFVVFLVDFGCYCCSRERSTGFLFLLDRLLCMKQNVYWAWKRISGWDKEVEEVVVRFPIN